MQNFLSAATGIAVAVALIRGLARHSAKTIGNFWTDLTRCTLYVLLPIATVIAILLVSQGVVQNFSAYKECDDDRNPRLPAAEDRCRWQRGDGTTSLKQTLPMGPMASQEAIKGSVFNDGGFL